MNTVTNKPITPSTDPINDVNQRFSCTLQKRIHPQRQIELNKRVGPLTLRSMTLIFLELTCSPELGPKHHRMALRVIDSQQFLHRGIEYHLHNEDGRLTSHNSLSYT